jgi:hypothetical protein
MRQLAPLPIAAFKANNRFVFFRLASRKSISQLQCPVRLFPVAALRARSQADVFPQT